MATSRVADLLLQKIAKSHFPAAENVPTSILILITTTLFILIVAFRSVKPRQRILRGIPIVGGDDAASVKESRIRFVHDGMNMLLEGYKKVRELWTGYHMIQSQLTGLQTSGGMYYVPSKLGERLMLPTKYLEDLKSAPTHEVDFVATFIEVCMLIIHSWHVD